jgi:hypothetical protein
MNRTNLNSGPFFYIDTNNKPAVAFNNNPGALTTSSSQNLTLKSVNNFTWRVVQNPFRAWITNDGTTVEQATPLAGLTGTFTTSATSASVTMSTATTLTATIGGVSTTTFNFSSAVCEISSIFIGIHNATATTSMFNFEASLSSQILSNLDKIRAV